MVGVEAKKHTVEDYYLFMSKLGDFFEYADGEIFSKYGDKPLPADVIDYVISADFDIKDFTFPIPMPTRKHQLIASNVLFGIRTNLKANAKKFFVYGDGTKLLIADKGTYRVPDLAVTQKETEVFDEKDQLVNPLIIVEIWSPSTDYKDRGIKMREYQSITSLQEYVMISQDEIRVEHFTRQSPNEWLYRAYEQETAQIHLSTIDVSILLSEIYAE
ncbi:MAG: hypothetical protein OHK0057_29350 [Thermoflexibacter sp.]